MQIIDRLKAGYESVKESYDDKIDNALDNATIEAYKKYYPRWRKICEVSTNDDIDFKNPYVELESKLCDVRNLKMIRNGVHRDDFFKLLSDEAKRIYLEEVGEDGEHYTDLEHPRVLRSMIKRIKQRMHNKDTKDALDEWAETD